MRRYPTPRVCSLDRDPGGQLTTVPDPDPTGFIFVLIDKNFCQTGSVELFSFLKFLYIFVKYRSKDPDPDPESDPDQ